LVFPKKEIENGDIVLCFINENMAEENGRWRVSREARRMRG
jgi:hypothetical protein